MGYNNEFLKSCYILERYNWHNMALMNENDLN